jgi:hypothetical protein
VTTIVVGLAIYGALRLAADSLGWLLDRLEAASAACPRPSEARARDGRPARYYN